MGLKKDDSQPNGKILMQDLKEQREARVLYFIFKFERLSKHGLFLCNRTRTYISSSFFFFFINWNTVRIRKTTEATFAYYLHDLKRTNKLRFHGALQCLFLHFARKATKDKDASIRDIDPTTRTTPRFCIRENVAK